MGHVRLIADRTRSREIVPLLSCTKHIDQHKSCYGFQDVWNEVELILAHSATFSTPGNMKTMTIWAYLLRSICHKRHLSGPVRYLDFRETGPRAYKRQFTRYSWINRREGRHSGRFPFTKRFRKIPRISVGNVHR